MKISVQDTGIGIKHEDKNKLFKLFGYLKESQRQNVHGIGLGLVISKQIVEQFGGNIFVESELGVGTSFTFILKLNKENISLNLSQNQIPNTSEFKCDSKLLYFNWSPPNSLQKE